MAYWWLMTKDWCFQKELKQGESEMFQILTKPIYYEKLAVGDKMISFEANGKSSTVTAFCSIVEMKNGEVWIR